MATCHTVTENNTDDLEGSELGLILSLHLHIHTHTHTRPFCPGTKCYSELFITFPCFLTISVVTSCSLVISHLDSYLASLPLVSLPFNLRQRCQIWFHSFIVPNTRIVGTGMKFFLVHGTINNKKKMNKGRYGEALFHKVK